MGTQLYTKKEIAQFILNQFDLEGCSAESVDKLENEIASMQEELFISEITRAGFAVEKFTYNGYVIK